MKIKSICLFSMLLFSCSWCYGQSWLWGAAGYSNIYAGYVNNPVATDTKGNVYTTATYQTSVTFGSFTLNDLHNEPYLVKYNSGGNVIWVFQPKGNGYSFGDGVATDTAGNILMTGLFEDTLTFGAYRLIAPGALNNNNYGYSTYLAKLNPNGNVLWAIQGKVTQTSAGFPTAINIDKAGNIYLAGIFDNTITFGSQTLTSPSDAIFLVKFDAGGNALWANQYLIPLGKTDDFNSLVTDNAGNICLGGSFEDTINFGAYRLSAGPTTPNALLVKCNSYGKVLWAKQSNGPNAGGGSVTIDNEDNIYITGQFFDTLTFGSDTLLSKWVSVFLTKYDSSGNIKWVKQSADKYGILQGTSLSSDAHNHIYLSGTGENSDSLIFGNFMLNVIPPQYFAFLIEFDTSGKALCGSIFTNDKSVGSNVNVTSDSSGNFIYMSGQFDDTVLTFGKDTLVPANENGNPFIARWQRCCTHQDTVPGNISVCKNKSCVLSASNGISYLWSNGNTTSSITVSPDSSANYQVIINEGDCSLDSTIHININPVPIPNITAKDKICIGKFDTITVSGGTYYKWSNGDSIPKIIVNPDTTTIYTVSVSNGFCSAIDSVVVQVFPYPVPSISNTQFICPGQYVMLAASGGIIYSWNNGETTSSISVGPANNTTFIVTVSNGVCTVLDSVKVILNLTPVLNVCCDSSILYGQNVQLVSSGGTFYSWSPQSGLNCDNCPDPIAEPNITTTYTLTAINDSGCISTRTVTIDVQCGEVFVPDVFSPNQNVNNILYVRGPCISTLDFIVFDRWGNKVYETQDKNDGWDGTYKGQAMNTATYMYYAKATMYDGSVVEKKGSVTLVR